MARLTAPLFSLTASGTIANALTFSTWKGVPYVRTRVIPANPKSAAQQEVRGIFSTLSEMWKRMPAGARVPFDYAARGRPFTARNKHIGVNVAVLQGESDLDNLVMSVATGGAVPPATITPADETGQVLSIACTAPTIPVGYTLEWMNMAAVLDGDPSPVITRTVFWDEDDSDPYTVNLNVGTAGDYQCAAWCVMAKGGIYYCSAALRDQQAIA